MPIFYVPLRSSRRVFTSFPTFTYRFNEAVLAPFRLFTWWVHFTALTCAAAGSNQMIIESSLAEGYRQSDYRFLRQVTDLCLAVSFLCIFFNLWGILTGRTLRSGLANGLQGICHAVAGVLLIAVWHRKSHVARIWHVFYIFGIIPTFFEAIALFYSYWKGLDAY